jgi:hypothetical protein
MVRLNDDFKQPDTDRIQPGDGFGQILMKMTEGNPGALNVLAQMMGTTDSIDKANAMGPLGPLLSLDSFRIYGSRIWGLYKDVCREDIVSTLAVLRGRQLGIISQEVLNHAIDYYGEGLDVQACRKEVKSRLGNGWKEPERETDISGF